MRSPRVLAGALVGLLAAPVLAASLSDRLTEEYLSDLRTGTRANRMKPRIELEAAGLQDIRCVLHAHSRLSHDSRGTEEQIVAAAKKAGVRALFMSEHPTAERTWSTEGLRGEKNGIFFVPGAELSDGLLIWRSEGKEWTPGMKAAEVLQAVQGTDTIAFIAHPEKRKEDADWELPTFHGMEIYNTHADAEDSDYEKMLASFQGDSPFKLLGLLGMLKKFPKESFAALFDEQKDMMTRWDRLNMGYLNSDRRVVGIAGNDSHQNVGLSVETGEGGLIIKDALGKVVSKPGKKGGALPLGGVGGAPLVAHTFDPYEISFGYVSTHLLLDEGSAVSEGTLVDALVKGRAYVAFDWMADPTGFRFGATGNGKSTPMGGDASLDDRPTLEARTTVASELRLLRNGEEIRRVEGSELSEKIVQPGVYRVEVWLQVGRESRPWIYSNPIFVK